MTKIIHTTISPCDNERRIFNEALTASHNGYRVEILALKIPGLPEISLLENIVIRRLSVRRWQGGPLKFLSFNWKLFRRLLKSDFKILHSHDLWVLPASACAAFLKKLRLIYDAHEFYRGLEIFKHKPFSGKIWKLAETLFIRQADAVITINSFHKDLFRDAYRTIAQPEVLMNFPLQKENLSLQNSSGFSARNRTVLFQGIFKEGRGLPQLIDAIRLLNSTDLELIGFGELEKKLKKYVEQAGLQERVKFKGKVSWESLLNYTQKARAGLVLFEPNSVNYKYASPNKFFEYVMAGTPVIASDIPTFRQFISEFEVGILVDPNNSREIQEAIGELSENKELWERLHKNCLEARKVWNWESQEKKLLEIYERLE